MKPVAFRLDKVGKTFKHFTLRDIDLLELPRGSIMGFVGPNGAGKSTTMRILLGVQRADTGRVELLGHAIPKEQVEAKRGVGFVSEDMRLYGGATVGWHMRFVRSLYPSWDEVYSMELLRRFDLVAEQKVKQLSHGQRVKTALLLALARRPSLLVLDEPTTGLDPVVRQEVLGELLDALGLEGSSVFFSSHNTQDVEQISDLITFINRGEILESEDKESFLDRWRRLSIEFDPGAEPELPEGCSWTTRSGRSGVLLTERFSDELLGSLGRRGAVVQNVQRMTLEEIFLARVGTPAERRVA